MTGDGGGGVTAIDDHMLVDGYLTKPFVVRTPSV